MCIGRLFTALKENTFIGGMELVSLRCNRDFTSASSYGLGWYKYAIATQWYQFHTTDAWWFSLNIYEYMIWCQVIIITIWKIKSRMMILIYIYRNNFLLGEAVHGNKPGVWFYLHKLGNHGAIHTISDNTYTYVITVCQSIAQMFTQTELNATESVYKPSIFVKYI